MSTDAVVKRGAEEEKEEKYQIKPDESKPKVDTSDWPLLLKNWDKRKFDIASQPLLNDNARTFFLGLEAFADG